MGKNDLKNDDLSWNNKSALSFFNFLLFNVFFSGFDSNRHFFQVIFSHDFTSNSIAYLCQNLFLEVKKPEIKETKTTFIIPTFKSSYWGPFTGLKIQDLIRISRTFPCGLFCPRSFCKINAA